jgi:hypothetical protein
MANKRTVELSRTESAASSPATSRSASGSMQPHQTASLMLVSSTIPWIMATDRVPGSKASSPTEQKNQTDYQFLNFTHPSEAKASGARKTVRSHVTRQQHQREHAQAAARRAKSFPQPEDVETKDEPPPSRPHAATFPANRPALEVPSSSTQSTSSPEGSSQSPSPSNSPMHGEQRAVSIADYYPQDWLPDLRNIVVCS